MVPRRTPIACPDLQVFLSFNPSVTSADEIADEGDGGVDPGGGEAASTEHPLRYRWIVWQQLMASGKAAQYSEATRQVASCGTVEDFWGVWGRLPQPSELLGKAMVNDQAADGFQTVDALMLFRDGIMPQWEDEANAEGGHFQLQLRPALGGGQIDEYWNNIVLGVVGATIEPPDMITGLRLVDKLSAGRGTGHLRIEVWFNDLRDTRAVQALQLSVERCLATKTLEGRIGAVPKLEMKNHKFTRHQ